MRVRQVKIKDEVKDDEEEFKDQEALTEPSRKKRRLFVDREKVQYATELIENKLSNKEMSLLLELSIACVRKLKMKILNGTVDELIDDSEEHYSNLEKNKDESLRTDPDDDPLHLMEEVYNQTPVASTSKYGPERKTKVVLRDREMFMAALLRENNIRTMDIAKMMKISERSVTRLLARAKEANTRVYGQDVIEEVERLLASKDDILNETVPVVQQDANENKGVDDSKRQLGASLLAMNVSAKDIAKMLDVTERTVQRWKAKFQKVEDDKEENCVFKNLPAENEEELEEELVYEKCLIK